MTGFVGTHRHRLGATSAVATLLATALLLEACGKQTIPCGTFTFSGSPDGNRGENISNSFAFSPAACSATCTCNQIAYVQIVRIIDRDTGAFLAPNTDQMNRTLTTGGDPTINGWAVDRLSGRIWGYYGRNNDGSFAGTLTTGSNATPAVLLDEPSGWPDNAWFDAVDVPVCLDANASCSNGELGYYYWLFIVQTGGGTGAPVSEIGVDWNRDAVDAAVGMWNTTAPALRKNVFPGFTRISNQVVTSSGGCSIAGGP